MTDTNCKVPDHYSVVGLTDRIKPALATVTPETEVLTVAQLAPLDQFHTRGILATAELAGAARLDASTRVLDLGCGIGGPARYLAATFGCKVTGIDLSRAFIDADTWLTARPNLAPSSAEALISTTVHFLAAFAKPRKTSCAQKIHVRRRGSRALNR